MMTLHQNIDLHDELAWRTVGGRASDVPIVPNRPEIEAFLRDYVGTIIHVVSIKPDAVEDDHDKIHARYFGDAVGDAAKWLAAENAGGRNCYWTVNVTLAGLNRKPSKKDIAAARFGFAHQLKQPRHDLLARLVAGDRAHLAAGDGE